MTTILMRRSRIFFLTATMTCWLSGSATLTAQTSSDLQKLMKTVEEQILQAERDRIVVGAQVAVGSSKADPITNTFGVTSPKGGDRVNDDTLFCIGSCSKPFASACIMTLVDESVLKLDTPVSQWVPEMKNLSVADGQGAKSNPTMRQLLAHRAGIYSQKSGRMTAAQTKAIRDFRISLQESVKIIGQQPLKSQPGEEFAYSGAGYCVAGYAAQRAAGKNFEKLLQKRICEPLGLSRTTYFPSPKDANVATPGFKNPQGQIEPNPNAPHSLNKSLKFPLIGGSLYSTACESATFARMILNRGMHDNKAVLSDAAWIELTRQQFPQQGYGLGWGLTIRNGKTSVMQHNGALYGHHSLVYIDLAKDRYVVVHWTLADPVDPRQKSFMRPLMQSVQ